MITSRTLFLVVRTTLAGVLLLPLISIAQTTTSDAPRGLRSLNGGILESSRFGSRCSGGRNSGGEQQSGCNRLHDKILQIDQHEMCSTCCARRDLAPTRYRRCSGGNDSVLIPSRYATEWKASMTRPTLAFPANFRHTAQISHARSRVFRIKSPGERSGGKL